MSSVHVALVGDSVLDNTYWIPEKTKDVTYHLRQLGVRVTNHSIDEATIDDVLGETMQPRYIYSFTRKIYRMEPHNLPLNLAPDVTHVVISIGGNDILNKLRARESIDAIVEHMKLKFATDMPRILAHEALRGKQVLLVIPYFPFLGWNFFPPLFPTRGDTKRLINSIFPLYYGLKRTKPDLQFVELPPYFDGVVEGMYGSSPIEPGQEGGQLIANLIYARIFPHRPPPPVPSFYPGNTPYRGWGICNNLHFILSKFFGWYLPVQGLQYLSQLPFLSQDENRPKRNSDSRAHCPLGTVPWWSRTGKA